jgi:tetratricopeptide (TPR) repeat protein
LTGRFDESVERLRIALHLDPLSQAINRGLVDALERAGKYDEAILQVRRTKEVDPSWSEFERYLAAIYLLMGEYESVLETDPTGRWSIAALVALGRRDEALAVAERYEGSALRTRVQVAAALGDPDKALPLLIQAYDERQPWVPQLAFSPYYGSIRSDPRIRELIRKMGFPE